MVAAVLGEDVVVELVVEVLVEELEVEVELGAGVFDEEEEREAESAHSAPDRSKPEIQAVSREKIVSVQSLQ